MDMNSENYKIEMQKIFKSKIGLELVIPLVLVFGTVFFLTIKDNSSWLGLAILLPLVLFIFHLFMNTYYTIDGNYLIVKSGFIINKTIDIKQIKKISETRDPISAPATSLDRLDLAFGTSGHVLLSPKLKKEFIEALVMLNPAIEIKLKKK
jgi:hypothetical protein